MHLFRGSIDLVPSRGGHLAQRSCRPVTWVFLCSLGGTMSRVFVRIHWCWRCVAVPMAPGTGHGPLSVWKIVARLSLLFDFDPIAVVPNGGHLRG